MKLLNNKYNICFDFSESNIFELVCEKPNIYNDLVCDLYNANNDLDSHFILLKDDNLIEFDKNCEIIFNPFCIDINNKRNIDKFYGLLVNKSNYDEFYLRKNELFLKIFEFVNEVSFNIDFPILYDEDTEVKNLFKAINLKIDMDTSNLLELLDSYIKITNRLQGEKIYILINLKSFLSLKEIKMFYESALYNKYKLILFENIDRSDVENERKIIIDNDGCIIA